MLVLTAAGAFPATTTPPAVDETMNYPHAGGVEDRLLTSPPRTRGSSSRRVGHRPPPPRRWEAEYGRQRGGPEIRGCGEFCGYTGTL
jgi:hypothetical protein